MKRVFRIALLILGWLLLIAVAIALIKMHGRAAPVAPAKPCTAQACIKLTDPDGQQYTLNDFQFAPNHCIDFVSLPDQKRQHVCGDYHMDWIGPAPQGMVKA